MPNMFLMCNTITVFTENLFFRFPVSHSFSFMCAMCYRCYKL
uniref:Uncharacterized protein n=1 Tax=Arundo donax TaxID=35708 RepID=A0A0A9HLB7_ARUDO